MKRNRTQLKELVATLRLEIRQVKNENAALRQENKALREEVRRNTVRANFLLNTRIAESPPPPRMPVNVMKDRETREFREGLFLALTTNLPVVDGTPVTYHLLNGIKFARNHFNCNLVSCKDYVLDYTNTFRTQEALRAHFDNLNACLAD